MVQEVKQLTETPEDGESAPAPAAAASSSNSAGPSGESGGAASISAASASISLPFTVANTPIATLHDDTLALMTFAAKLNFSVFEGEIEEKLNSFWKTFVRVFFVAPDLAVSGGSSSATAAGSSDA